MSDLAFVLRFPALCTEGVIRRDEFQPCDKPAVAVRIDPEAGLYPVCARHARGDMVLLVVLIAAVRAQVSSDIMARSVALSEHNCGDPACPAEASLIAYRLAARIAEDGRA